MLILGLKGFRAEGWRFTAQPLRACSLATFIGNKVKFRARSTSKLFNSSPSLLMISRRELELNSLEVLLALFS